MKTYLGIDVGSVSTDLVLIDENNNVLSKVYIRTSGQPIKAVQKGLKLLAESVDLDCIEVAGVGTTGSARYLSAVDRKSVV